MGIVDAMHEYNSIFDYSYISNRLIELERHIHTKASLPTIQNKIQNLQNISKNKLDRSIYNTKVSHLEYSIGSKANSRYADNKLKIKLILFKLMFVISIIFIFNVN